MTVEGRIDLIDVIMFGFSMHEAEKIMKQLENMSDKEARLEIEKLMFRILSRG